MSFFKKITETVSKGVSTATEKAQQTVEVTRLHAQISGKRKEIEAIHAEIGAAVFDAYRQKDLSLAESKVIPACEEILVVQGEIEALEERIMQLRNEKECVCGRKVPYDTRFCPSCGHPFPEPVVSEPDPLTAEESKPAYEGDFPSADPFAEPPAAKTAAVESPSAADWADVGLRPRDDRENPGWTDAGIGSTPEKPDWSDAGLPPRGTRAPSAPEWTEPAASPAPAEEETAEESICSGCGKHNPPSARFCPSCGTPQQY